MFILGVGAAYPEVEISDLFLASIGLLPSKEEAIILARVGVRSRRTSLPIEYIQTTKNLTALKGREVASSSPTTLGESAARQALERAGVSADQVGLVIADCGTPHQSCPSEAQRIAGALGLKVPAYDVVAGEAALPFYLDMLSAWKPDRLPDYILFISANTPTQHVAYAGQALPAYLYGDAAAALVLSPRRKGKLKVGASYLGRHGALRASSVVGRHLSFNAEPLLAQGDVASAIAHGLKTLSGSRMDHIIGPQLYGGEFQSYETSCGLSQGAMISGVERIGYSVGASHGVALANIWDSIEPDAQIAVVHVGDGMVSGSMLVGS